MVRKINSVLWKYFTRDEEQKTAKCNYCDKTLSFKTTIGNLKAHMKRMHNRVWDEIRKEISCFKIVRVDDGQSNGSHYEVAEEETSSDVWSYYEREAGDRARCVVCRAVVARTDLKGHLKANHPKLVAEVDFGSEDAASDSQEDVYTEIVYLEEEQNAKKQISAPTQKLKSKPYFERPEPRKREPSTSSDEAPLRRKKIKTEDKPENSDEIEQFGKYVTCLLKKIPPAACMELQAEIINLIMKKQLELKKNETSVLAANKMVDIGGDRRADGVGNIASTSNFNISISNGSNVIETTE